MTQKNSNKVSQNTMLDINLQDTKEQNKAITKKNNLLRKTFSKLKIKESKVVDEYEIKQMTVYYLIVHLNALEEDYAKVMSK